MLPSKVAEAEKLLEELTSAHYTADFRVPGYWSGDD